MNAAVLASTAPEWIVAVSAALPGLFWVARRVLKAFRRVEGLLRTIANNTQELDEVMTRVQVHEEKDLQIQRELIDRLAIIGSELVQAVENGQG